MYIREMKYMMMTTETILNNTHDGYTDSNAVVSNFISKTNRLSLLSIGLNEDKTMSDEAIDLAKRRNRDLKRHSSRIPRDSLKILYANMRSAKKKLANLDSQAMNMGADILVLTETWYKDTTSVVVSQLRVLNCCRLLKVFGIRVQILMKAMTFWIQRNLAKF